MGGASGIWGNKQKTRGKGWSRKIFLQFLKMGNVVLFLIYISPPKYTNRFKIYKEVPSAFNSVSADTEYNFKAKLGKVF